jgi:hypothetical protein
MFSHATRSVVIILCFQNAFLGFPLPITRFLIESGELSCILPNARKTSQIGFSPIIESWEERTPASFLRKPENYTLPNV